jgi:hypothetical protein
MEVQLHNSAEDVNIGDLETRCILQDECFKQVHPVQQNTFQNQLSSELILNIECRSNPTTYVYTLES